MAILLVIMSNLLHFSKIHQISVIKKPPSGGFFYAKANYINSFH